MAKLNYDRGDPKRPSGHAFLYFGGQGDPQVVATYIVVPPISLDLGKYMPPILASSLGTAGLGAQTSFLPIPPVPEPVEIGQIVGLAELRDDDILSGGPQGIGDVTALLSLVVEIGDAYAQAYRDSIVSEPRPEPEAQPEPSEQADSPQVRAMLYTAQPERDRLEELARQVGALRYGLEVGDATAIEAALGEMRAIGLSLPDKYRAAELVDAAQRPDAPSLRLAQLYLDRGFKLCSENYDELPPIEAEIALLTAGQS